MAPQPKPQSWLQDKGWKAQSVDPYETSQPRAGGGCGIDSESGLHLLAFLREGEEAAGGREAARGVRVTTAALCVCPSGEATLAAATSWTPHCRLQGDSEVAPWMADAGVHADSLHFPLDTRLQGHCGRKGSRRHRLAAKPSLSHNPRHPPTAMGQSKVHKHPTLRASCSEGEVTLRPW